MAKKTISLLLLIPTLLLTQCVAIANHKTSKTATELALEDTFDSLVNKAITETLSAFPSVTKTPITSTPLSPREATATQISFAATATQLADNHALIKTIIDEKETYQSIRSLTIVYKKDGNLWGWREAIWDKQLTFDQYIGRFTLSDDGVWAVYEGYGLWSVNLESGGRHLIISETRLHEKMEYFLGRELEDNAPLRLVPSTFEWFPNSHILIFTLGIAGPTGGLNEEAALYFYDLDHDKLIEIDFPEGVGNLQIAPDEKTISYTTPTGIGIYPLSGKQIRYEPLIEFERLPSACEGGKFHPLPAWRADSQALLVNLPTGEKGICNNLNANQAVIWEIPIDGTDPEILLSFDTRKDNQIYSYLTPDRAASWVVTQYGLEIYPHDEERGQYLINLPLAPVRIEFLDDCQILYVVEIQERPKQYFLYRASVGYEGGWLVEIDNSRAFDFAQKTDSQNFCYNLLER